MSKLKSTLIVLLLGLTTAVVVGLLLLTLFLPGLLQRFACAPYGIRCTIGHVSIRPHLNVTADLVINHLILFDPDGRTVALRVKHLAATLNVLKLIFTRQIMPTNVRIENPELLLRQLDDNRWNLLALVQEVQRHQQPATQPTPLQLPRLSVAGGTLHIRAHQVTDVNISLEPKQAPLLFEAQAEAVVDRQSIRISGALKNTLEGQILAQVQQQALNDVGEATPPGIVRPLAQAALRFRINHPDRAIAIPEWSLEADGAAARGKAAIRYASWPPAYAMTVAAWRADLGVLTHQLSLPWLSGLTGIVEGKPTTLQGRWPDLPVGQVTAMLKDGGLDFPAQQFRVVELTGDLSLYRTENRLQLQAGIYGKALELLGQRYGVPSLQASLSVDPATGDVTAEALRASIAGMSVKARGNGQQWGRANVTLMTTELKIEPTLLSQLPQLADRGVTITRLVDPSLYVWWPGAGRPWKVEIAGRSVQLRAAAMNDTTTLQRTRIAIQGVGLSERRLEGTLAIEQADLVGRRLRALRARFELGPGRIQLPEFHIAVGDGTIQGHASLSRSAPRQEVHFTLSARGLRPQSLLTSGENTGQAHGITLNAELSVDATFGGSPSLVADGRMTIRDLALSPAQNTTQPTPPLMRFQGSIPFTLDKGLLTIPTTTLHGDGGFAFNFTGSLPLGGDGSSVTRIRLSVPWTEVSTLRSTLTALTRGQPESAHLAGQLQADLELVGRNYYGALALRNVDIESNFFRLDAATGVIPLRGRIGQSSIDAADGTSPSKQIGGRRLSEREYQAALERFSQIPAEVPASLTINSLRYDPIELRHIKVALAQSDNQVAIQRFTFDAWGGRWSGWGAIEPLGGGISLTVLTDGLSLRAICDAFRPFQGYISGRINGMTDLRAPGFALERAHANARFWAVGSLQEGRKISRALIEQLAGQHIRYFSPFGVARRYDRGVLDIALKAGDLIFHELEISHTTLGWKDLDVRVSPAFNKIRLTHLIESIREAIERVRAPTKPDR